MKKYITLAVALLLLPHITQASEHTEKPDVETGLFLPTNMLYPAQLVYENVRVQLEMNKSEKQERHLRYAERRIIEMEKMKSEYIDENSSEKDIQTFLQGVERAEESRQRHVAQSLMIENVSTSNVEDVNNRHRERLNDLKDEVPRPTRKGISQALNSTRGFERGVREAVDMIERDDFSPGSVNVSNHLEKVRDEIQGLERKENKIKN